MVLTKQSALFNAWKEMNRVAAEHEIPFRCVTQWATHQTGKIHDTLGIKLTEEPRNTDKRVAMDGSAAIAVPHLSAHVSVQKRAGRGKKADKK
jgi:hypothetical protein